MRQAPLLPLLLVACLSFLMGAFLFSGRNQEERSLETKRTPGEAQHEQDKGDALALPPVAPPISPGTGAREVVAAGKAESDTATIRGQSAGSPNRISFGIFGELDALDLRGGISDAQRGQFLDVLMDGLVDEEDLVGALQVLELYGQGVDVDHKRYFALASAMKQFGLIEECLALHHRLCDSLSNITRPLEEMRGLSAQAALDALRANFERMSERQQIRLRVFEVQLLADLGRRAEGLELMKGVLAGEDPSAAELWVLNELAPLEARAFLEGLYKKDAGRWTQEYVDHLEANGEVELALGVLRDAMAEAPFQEAYSKSLSRLSPLEGYSYLVGRGTPEFGDSAMCEIWADAGSDLQELGQTSQAIELWKGALKSSSYHQDYLYGELLEHAPVALAEIMELKVGESKDWESLETLATAYWHAGRTQDALLTLKTCQKYIGEPGYYDSWIAAVENGEDPKEW